MTNAARELLDVFKSWIKANPDEPVYLQRQVDGDNGADWVIYTKHASLLAGIDAALNALEAAGEEVDVYRRNQDAWAKYVYLPQSTWSQAGRQAISQSAFDILQLLATYLDMRANQNALPAASKSSILATVQDALESLQGDDLDLEAGERAYLLSLLQAVQSAVQEKQIIGQISIESRINEVTGALVRLALKLGEQGLDEQAKHVMEKASKFARLRIAIQDGSAVASIISLGVSIQTAIGS
jgi:hypothetical protein